MNLVILLLSFIAPAVTALGLWFIGNKKKYGFLVGISAEVFWMLLGWFSEAYGLVFWSLIFTFLYLRNYLKWSNAKIKRV